MSQFWEEPPMRVALANRDLQTVLRSYMECTALTQETVALLVDRNQSTISKIRAGRRRRFSIQDIEAFRDGLHIPGYLLGLQPGPHERTTRVTLDAATAERGEDPTNRREFNRAALLAVLGVSGATGVAFTADEPPAQIGMEHVRMLEQAVQRLEQHDAQVGGAALSETATWLYSRARRWLSNSSYSVEVGEALHSAVGELGAWVGWMAYDAGQHANARHHYQETLLLARMADDHPLEVQVLCFLALQSVRLERPREALQIAKTGQRIAAGWATPRLQALLHLRAARAYAVMDNEGAFGRELALAKARFGAGTHVDDPLFLHHVTAGELTTITALSYLDLGKPERASELLRTVTGENPEAARRRNTSIRTVSLARARLQAGDATEAAQIGLAAIPLIGGLDSTRARRGLSEFRAGLVPYTPSVPKAREFVEAHDTTFARAGKRPST